MKIEEMWKENKESRKIAEIQLERSGNPIGDAISANKIWNDHLRRIGVKNE